MPDIETVWMNYPVSKKRGDMDFLNVLPDDPGERAKSGEAACCAADSRSVVAPRPGWATLLGALGALLEHALGQ
jgi:hypothetical protein